MRLKDYIQGNRRGKEANRLEREAMSDPFLQEAIDGFDAVAGNHAQIIERLETKFTRPAVSMNRYTNLLWYGSIAASILLLVGVSAYFFLGKTEKTSPMIAMNQLNENKEIIPYETMSSQLLQMEEKQQQETQAPPKMQAITPELEKSMEITQKDADIVDAVANDVVVDVHEVVVAEVCEDSETHAIKPSNDEQTVSLKQNDLALSEVAVTGYGAQKKSTVTDAVSKSAVQSPFGEKEFQNYCQQNGNKNVCDGKQVFVKLSFSINENGKPTDINYKKYSCEEAKKEMERLLSSSPAWTMTNRKVNMTIEW